jgi:hypothetical protein
MPTQQNQSNDNPQRLVNCYETRIGMSRLTKTTISEGPNALEAKAFNFLITAHVFGVQIFESLDAAYRTADMIIDDPINFRAVVPFTGHEIITVGYKNALTSSDSKMKIIHFMIHSITEDAHPNAMDSGFKRLTLKLVEFPAFEFLMSNQYYKTYPIDEKNTPNQRFSDVVKDMLNDIEHFDKWYDIEVEDSTQKSVNLFIPNWLPMKVINYCKKYTVSQAKNYPAYVFHIGNVVGNNKPTAFFKPIYSFVDNANKFRPYGTSYIETNKTPESGSYSMTDIIQKYSFEYHDTQKKVCFLSGNTEVLFDYLQDNSYIASNYDDYLKSTHKGISPFPVYPYGHGNQWSSFHRSPWNYQEGSTIIKNEIRNEYVNGLIDSGVSCKGMCPIYEGRACGERAELIFNINDKDKICDKMMSGAWITWSIVDVLINGASYTSIHFKSDGFVEIKDPSQTFTKINTITGIKAPESIKV